MKRLLMTTALLGMPLFAHAQPVSGLYVGGGAGVNLLQNETLKPSTPNGVIKRSYVFDPGVSAYGSFGYGLGNGLRIEAEGDYLTNHVRKAKLSLPERAGGHQDQFGGFLNALYDFNLGLPVYPYLGAGIGYQAVDLVGVNSSLAGATANARGSETSGNFAYQGIVGVSYPIAALPGLSLTADYRMVGVLQPSPDYNRKSGNIAYKGELGNIFNNEVTFGFRYGFGVAAPVPPPAQLAVVPAPAPARTYLIFFDWDRADLTDRAKQIIAEAALASTRVQTTRIEVQGNADRSGTPAYNQGLSLRRAQTVAAELVRHGVPRTEIDIQAFGDTRPLVPTAAGVREPQNRRVAIILR
jgi:OOP family OmpA-OmpF porin